MIEAMGEALSKRGDWHKLGSSSGGSSTTAVVLLNTLLILVLSTVAVFLTSAISTVSLSIKLRLQGRPPLPPGRMGLPIVGETLSILANTRLFEQSRHAKYGPVFKSNIFGETVFVESPDNNKFLFPNESKLVRIAFPKPVKKIIGPNALLLKTGAAFKRLRRHLNPILSPSALAQHVPRIERHVMSHLTEFWQPAVGTLNCHDQDFEIPIFKSINRTTFSVIANLVLSLDPHDPDTEELWRLNEIWTTGIVALPINLPGTAHNRAMKSRAGILAILEKLMVRRRVELKEGKATPTQDLLSYFLTQPDDTGALITEPEMKDNLLLFLNAGHTSSSHIVTMTLRSIALYPDVYDRLKKEHDSIAEQKSHGESLTKGDLAEMKYTWCVIQETMRVVPAVRGGFRETMKDLEYGGFTIPKGWKMFWSTTAHLDPKCFKEPEKFDPTRFDEEHAHDIRPHVYSPFGGGPRLCPGNEFAKIEMLVYMHYVVRHYRLTLVNPDEPIIYNPFPEQKSGTLMRIRKLR